MSGRLDEASGRAKKAAGDLADDQSRKGRGRIDRLRGRLKTGIDKASRKTKRGIRRGS
jgi:uncharacterized protein YjbJ (UPF0337 family)